MDSWDIDKNSYSKNFELMISQEAYSAEYFESTGRSVGNLCDYCGNKITDIASQNSAYCPECSRTVTI